ncbi:MAG: inner membrane-spanning protein YciB [Hyphomicrobiaceae bacterium]
MKKLGSILREPLLLKLLLEFIPLILFFVFTERFDVYVGTGIMMVATVICMTIIWMKWRKIGWMALITAATALVFGAMTIYWTDPLYVKLKPTIVCLIFAAILLGGLALDRALLKPLLGVELNITERGWRKITWRIMWYFIVIAFLNEAVWRGANLYWADDLSFATEVWAGFKAFVMMPLTIVFCLLQIPLAKRFRKPGTPPNDAIDAIADFFDGTYRVSGGSSARDAPGLSASPRDQE